MILEFRLILLVIVISIAFFLKRKELPTRESFIVSLVLVNLFSLLVLKLLL